MATNFDLSSVISGSLVINETANQAIKAMHVCKNPYKHMYEDDPMKTLGIVPFSERLKVPETVEGTPIQESFRDVNVFITGGLGFLGKVLVEKLVRSMPHLSHIYLLIRDKRGKSCQERFKLLLEDKLFLRVKAEIPDYPNKITALPGDIFEPNLGLSDEDRQLILDSVHVVFHCAADVRFLEPLKLAVKSNVLGAKHVMDLAKQMRNLKSYVHVSTAYSQCVNRVINESVPKMSINYKEILALVDSSTDQYIEDNLESILQEWPNTYSYTKALCEDMIQEEAEGLPMCIFRPSIVMNTYKEPFRGWLDNVQGVGGMILAVALGILHHSKFDISLPVDIVPVDYVANCMIAASSNINKREVQQPYVVNFTAFPKLRICWKHILQPGIKTINTWPMHQAIWYLSFFSTNSHFVDELVHLSLYKIKGTIMDTLAVLVGQKPRLSKIYSSIYAVKDKLHYFTHGFWEFKNDNSMKIWDAMTTEDRQIFNFDVSDIGVEEYFVVGYLGMKYFFLKETESIPESKRKLKWLYSAHVILKLVVGFGILKLAVNLARLLPL